ncbi:MAG: hypothetical protein ABEJ67_05075 [Halanaeroarchaeum sp.]
MTENRSDRFERLPATDAEREVDGRASRAAVVDWWDERFGIDPDSWDGFTLWEKGAGRVWALHHDLPGPVAVESLGLPILRTRQEFWKPTTDAAQRFGHLATRNVVVLSPDEAVRFVAGEDQDVDWNGDWGYLLAAHELAGDVVPIGVGLFTYGTLQSMVPKGRRREF